MKLILCAKCARMVSIPIDGKQAICPCKASTGQYADKEKEHIIVSPTAVVLTVSENDLIRLVTRKARSARLYRVDVSDNPRVQYTK